MLVALTGEIDLEHSAGNPAGAGFWVMCISAALALVGSLGIVVSTASKS